MRVTVNSILTVVSSKPVSCSVKVHTLSALDHAMSPHTLHIIFYYHNHERWFHSFDLEDPLRESLSQVLTLYPTVTGRLAPGHGDCEWQVNCNDAGVRVIIATVHASLHQWLRSASASDENLLVAWDHMPHHDPTTWSPFRLQINKFEGGGVALGVSCSHMVADLTFLASFFKSWTQVHRHLPITHPPLVAPLPTPESLLLPPRHATTSPINMATATFKFSCSIMKQCLSKVHHTCPRATPFDFLAALFWIRIASFKLMPPKTHSLRICTDFRSVLKVALPVGYFGNALHFSRVSRKLEDMQLGDTVGEVHRHVEGISEEEIWCSINEVGMVYGEELTCVCMEQWLGEEDDESLVYGAVFGKKEKPAHVSCRVGNVEGEGTIMVMPSSEGGLSRTVMVTLPQEQLAQLIKDEALLELEPAAFLLDH